MYMAISWCDFQCMGDIGKIDRYWPSVWGNCPKRCSSTQIDYKAERPPWECIVMRPAIFQSPAIFQTEIEKSQAASFKPSTSYYAEYYICSVIDDRRFLRIAMSMMEDMADIIAACVSMLVLGFDLYKLIIRSAVNWFRVTFSNYVSAWGLSCIDFFESKRRWTELIN